MTRLRGILTSTVRFGEWRTWDGNAYPRRCPIGLGDEPCRQLISGNGVGISKTIVPKMRMVDRVRVTWRGAACLMLAAIASVSASGSAQNTVVGKYTGPGG